jgi:hypothetical protein
MGLAEVEVVSAPVQTSTRVSDDSVRTESALETSGLERSLSKPRLTRSQSTFTRAPRRVKAGWKFKKRLFRGRLPIFIIVYISLGMLMFMYSFQQAVPVGGEWWRNDTWNSSSDEPPPLEPDKAQAWSWLDALYYSVTTISTVGYGDYSPFSGTKDPPGGLILVVVIYVRALSLPPRPARGPPPALGAPSVARTLSLLRL